MSDFYKLLGVTRGETLEEDVLKKAYKKSRDEVVSEKLVCLPNYNNQHPQSVVQTSQHFSDVGTRHTALIYDVDQSNIKPAKD
mmetsp:Transcript_2556/g.5657  ORF Transcript_2556/g.5657 Transcript_2556/m.5657 type:complete len:83 (-) Transcript_2556:172-420(-)